MNDTIGYEEDDAIDRYLNGQMAEPERTAFEVRVMENPALFERMQLLSAFAGGLQSESAALTKTGTAQVIGFPFWLRQSMLMAATVLVTVVAMQFYQNNRGAATPTAVMPVTTLVMLEATRDGAPASFTGAGPYLFQLDAGLGTTAKAFAVTLRRANDNAVVLQQQNLQVDGKGWVRLLVNMPLDGDFVAELVSTDANGAAQTASFKFSIGK